MNYLTIAELRHDTPQARDYARKAMGDSRKDSGHRLIWSLFGHDPEVKRDFIFRPTDEGRFMIVSDRPPVSDEKVWHIKTKPYAPQLEDRQRYGFALRVNPTFSLSQPGRTRSLRVDVLMHAKKQNGGTLEAEKRELTVIEWLANKLERSGACLEKELCQVLEYGQIHLPRKNPKHPATISVIDVEGVLSVTEPDALQKALFAGIGSGKAFGLGLLLLRPLGD